MMSRTSCLRGFTLLLALGLAACAATPNPQEPTAQSLIDNMRAPARATEESCAAANMALVCTKGTFSRVRKASSTDATCACAERSQAKFGAWH